MNLIWNIVRKDFRRLRWPLAAAWAVTAAKFAFGWWLLQGVTPELMAWRELPKAVTVLVGLEAVFTWLVTGMLVLEDGVVGAAAWRTRPIAGARLLAAKIAGAALFLVAPALAMGLPWWWFNGFGWGELGPAALGSVGLQVLVIVPSLFVAVWVDSMARFVVWSVAGVALLLTLPLVWALVLANRLPNGAEIGGLVIVAAAGGPMLGVVAWRYGGASGTRVAMATVVVTGGIVAGGVTLVWLANPPPREEWVERGAATMADVKVTWRSAAVHDVKTGPVPAAQVSSNLSIEGLPQDCSADLARAQHTWTWPDGLQVSREAGGWTTGGLRPHMLGLRPEEPDEETVRWQKDRLRERLRQASPFAVGRSSPRWHETGLLSQSSVTVQPSVAARLRAGPVDYALETYLRVARAQVWLEVPLREGAQVAAKGHRLRVVKVTPESTLRVLRTVETRPVWEGMAMTNFSAWFRAIRTPGYWAIDREKGRVGWIGGDTSATVMIAGVAVQTRTTRVYPPTIVRDGKWQVADPTWAERMRVVLVGWDEVARIKRGTQAKFSLRGEPE